MFIMLSLISCNTCHTFLPYINSVSRAIVDHCNIIAVTVKFLFLRCWKLLYNDFSRSLLVLVKTVVSFWQCDWNDSIAVEKICCQNKMLIILIISVGHNVCKGRTKRSYRTKLLCRQICGHCSKDRKNFLTFEKSSVCKDYLISFEMTFTRTSLRKISGKIYNVKDVGPLKLVFNWCAQGVYPSSQRR